MRINLPILTGTALLLVCAVLIIRHSGVNEIEAKSDQAHRTTHSTAARQGGQAMKMSMPAERAKRMTQPEGNVSEPEPQPAPAIPAAAIQLADDVQLPAAILALNAAQQNPDSALPAPVAASMQVIVDRFYQELAASSTNNESSDTLLIRPGPHVDRARIRANESYRKLFGEVAFNKMIVNAALEARLPVDTGSGDN